MPVRIRVADDLPACVTTLRRVHALSGYPARWPDDPAGWLCPAGLMTAWVAEQDGMVTGHVGLVRGVRARCLLEATGRDSGELAGIVRLFVDPAARRAGHARELLGAAVTRAVSGGMVAVLDVVEDAEAAIALYERSGWRLAGRERATWAVPSGVRLSHACRVGDAPHQIGRDNGTRRCYVALTAVGVLEPGACAFRVTG